MNSLPTLFRCPCGKVLFTERIVHMDNLGRPCRKVGKPIGTFVPDGTPPEQILGIVGEVRSLPENYSADLFDNYNDSPYETVEGLAFVVIPRTEAS